MMPKVLWSFTSLLLIINGALLPQMSQIMERYGGRSKLLEAASMIEQGHRCFLLPRPPQIAKLGVEPCSYFKASEKDGSFLRVETTRFDPNLLGGKLTSVDVIRPGSGTVFYPGPWY